MDRYELTLETAISPRRAAGLGCALVEPGPNGGRRLVTPPLDQAALFGLLRRLRDLGPGLVAVRRLDRTPKGATS